jgi:hypothetical protein
MFNSYNATNSQKLYKYIKVYQWGEAEVGHMVGIAQPV